MDPLELVCINEGSKIEGRSSIIDNFIGYPKKEQANRNAYGT